MNKKTPLDALAFLIGNHANSLRVWIKELNMRAIIAAPIEEKANHAVALDLDAWDNLGEEIQIVRELLTATEGLVLGDSSLERTVQSQLADIKVCLSIVNDFLEIAYCDLESYVKG